MDGQPEFIVEVRHVETGAVLFVGAVGHGSAEFIKIQNDGGTQRMWCEVSDLSGYLEYRPAS